MSVYTTLGAEEAAAAALSPFSVEKTLMAQQATLDRIQKDSAEGLKLRKIATYAAVAGAIFAAIRLSEIWIAVRRR